MSSKSWRIGSRQEQRVREIIERGDYDGEQYVCVRFPKQKFATQDYFGVDLICTNANQWLLCQVKYTADRVPPKRKKTIDAMLETPMPESTKRVLARVDGRTQEITWDEV